MPEPSCSTAFEVEVGQTSLARVLLGVGEGSVRGCFVLRRDPLGQPMRLEFLEQVQFRRALPAGGQPQRDRAAESHSERSGGPDRVQLGSGRTTSQKHPRGRGRREHHGRYSGRDHPSRDRPHDRLRRTRGVRAHLVSFSHRRTIGWTQPSATPSMTQGEVQHVPRVIEAVDADHRVALGAGHPQQRTPQPQECPALAAAAELADRGQR